jgi:hypothetical protein
MLLGMTGATWAFIAQVAITVASIAYQIKQAKKMRAAASAAEEARKGYEVVVDATVTEAPIVYGRALVGGVRVWHKTANQFLYTETNAQKTFSVGPPGSPAGTYIDYEWVSTNNWVEGWMEAIPVAVTKNYPATPAGLLNQTLEGSKNEFLFFQQVLCQGPIQGVYDVIIDENVTLNDPILGTYSRNSKTNQIDKVLAAFRTDVHYGDTPEEDSITTKNDARRGNAKFPGVAYASTFIRLDRDNPQFNNVPQVQYLIEGRKVYTYSGGVRSASKVYTNNPAWCLLDYLMDPINSKGLSITEIDIPSFEAAAAICNTIVRTNVPVGGKIWQSTTPSGRSVTTRNLPLYECNTILNPNKPVRENVETLLSTMGDARLVWSQGKYKLLLQYPASDAAVTLAATLTDDDLIQSDTVEIVWPSASQRLNYVTVRFHNESMDFKEDTVSWPTKKGGTLLKGLNASLYPVVNGWGNTNAGFRLLDAYGVWSGTETTCVLSWKFLAGNGLHTMRYTADNSATITIDGVSIPAANNVNGVYEYTFTRTKDTIVSIVVNATNSDYTTPKGFAGIITDSANQVMWTSRSPAYTGFATVVKSDAIYAAMLEEDGGVQLETDIFAEGVTDFYHAMAKAEELVRTSRSAFTIKFQYAIKDKFLEPGDFVSITSPTLGLTNAIIRVNSVEVKDNVVAEVSGERFSYLQLAWNVADDYYALPYSVYDSGIAPPSSVTVDTNTRLINNSSGRVTWSEVQNPSLSGYIIYVHESGRYNADGSLNWVEVGRVKQPPFDLPWLSFRSGMVGVVAYSGVRVSTMTMSSAVIFDKKAVKLSADSLIFTEKLDTSFLPTSITITATPSGYTVPVYRWFLNNVPIEDSPGVPHSTNTLTVSPFTTGVSRVYRVECAETGLELSTVSQDLLVLYSVKEGGPGATGPAGPPGPAGTPGIQTATVYLYQWSTSQPGNPNNNSTYTWSSASHSSYTGTNGWLTAPGANPGTPNINLWVATKSISETGGAASTLISWESGYTVNALSKNGLDGVPGVSTAEPEVYQWAITIPAGPTGTSVYTWSAGTFTNTPAGWSTTPGNSPSPGFTLYAARVRLVDTTNSVTSTITWTTAQIFSIGYAGEDGAAGAPGINALSGILTNEAVVVTADALGAGYSLTSAGGIFKVYSGITDVTTLSTFTGGSVKSNLTLTINSTTGVYSLSGASWNTDSEAWTLSATYNGTTISKVYTIAKSKQGVNAKTLSIAGTAQVFKYAGDGQAVPGQFIALTAAKQNTTAAVTWSATPSVNFRQTSTPGSTIVTTGDIVYLHEADFNGQSSVTITGTLTDGGTFTDKLTIIKIQDGASGLPATVYYVTVTPSAVVKDVNGNFIPTSITANAYQVTGNGAPTAYSGRFRIATSTDGTTYGANTDSTVNESSRSYTVLANTKLIRVQLYQAGGFTTLLDQEIIPAVADGATGTAGAPGTNGKNALTAFLTNSAHVLPADSAGTVSSYANSGTQVWLYEGATALEYDGTGTANGTWNVTAVGTSITVGTKSDGGAHAVYGAHSAATADTASINYTITGKRADGSAISLVLTQTFAKARQGTQGTTGSTGTAGNSYRTAYIVYTADPGTTPTTSTTSGSSTFPLDSVWGGTVVSGKGFSATVHALVAGEKLFQIDGIYNPATGNTVWTAPYLSSFKVGSLSAISANLGAITAGSITIGTNKTIIGSDGYAEFRGLRVRDESGNIILSTKSGDTNQLPSAYIPNLDAGKITTGQLTADRINGTGLNIYSSDGTPILVAGNTPGGLAFATYTYLINLSNCTQYGPNVKKTSGAAAAWDAVMYSPIRYKAVSVTWTVNSGNLSNGFMIMFTEAVTNSGWNESNHFAVHPSGTQVAIYNQSGSLIYPVTTQADNDTFCFEYNGRAVFLYKNGSLVWQQGISFPNGVYVKIPIFHLNTIVSNLNIQTLVPVTEGNLISTNSWKNNAIGYNNNPGTLPSDYLINPTSGPNGYNNIGILYGPSQSTPVQVWYARSGAATSENAEGGFHTPYFPADPTKLYRFSIYFQVSGASSTGSIFFGLYAAEDVAGVRLLNAADGVEKEFNVYFGSWNRSSFVPGRWYLVTGYVFPFNDTNRTNIADHGGVWDTTAGTKIFNNNFAFRQRNYNGKNQLRLRVYQYYTTQDASVTAFYDPRVEVIDGKETPMDALLAGGAISGRNPIKPETASTYIANLAVGNAQISSLHADKLIANTITTDKLKVNQVVNSLNSSFSYGSATPNVLTTFGSGNAIWFDTGGLPRAIAGDNVLIEQQGYVAWTDSASLHGWYKFFLSTAVAWRLRERATQNWTQWFATNTVTQTLTIPGATNRKWNIPFGNVASFDVNPADFDYIEMGIRIFPIFYQLDTYITIEVGAIGLSYVGYGSLQFIKV